MPCRTQVSLFARDRVPDLSSTTAHGNTTWTEKERPSINALHSPIESSDRTTEEINDPLRLLCFRSVQLEYHAMAPAQGFQCRLAALQRVAANDRHLR